MDVFLFAWNNFSTIKTIYFASLGHSLLLPCSSSDARMLLFNTNFSACKLIIGWKYLFFIAKIFFLTASFIFALMIVVNLLFFRSIQCCFVHLRFQGICLWRISALKEERKYERVVLSCFFVLFVLNVIVFVYNGLK